MKYYPIELSEFFVNSILVNLETDNKIAEDIYSGLQKLVQNSIESSFVLPKEELLDNLIKFYSERNLSVINDSALITFFQKIVGFSRANATDDNDYMKKEDCIDSILLPLLFEEWQKNKIVYEMSDMTLTDIKDTPELFYDNTLLAGLNSPIMVKYPPSISNGVNTDNDIVYALLSARQIDGEYYFNAWYFYEDSMDEYRFRKSFVKIPCPEEIRCIADIKSNGIDAGMVLLFISFLQGQKNNLVFKSKDTYKERTKNSPVRNKYSEVQIWEI